MQMKNSLKKFYGSLTKMNCKRFSNFFIIIADQKYLDLLNNNYESFNQILSIYLSLIVNRNYFSKIFKPIAIVLKFKFRIM